MAVTMNVYEVALRNRGSGSTWLRHVREQDEERAGQRALLLTDDPLVGIVSVRVLRALSREEWFLWALDQGAVLSGDTLVLPDGRVLPLEG